MGVVVVTLLLGSSSRHQVEIYIFNSFSPSVKLSILLFQWRSVIFLSSVVLLAESTPEAFNQSQVF